MNRRGLRLEWVCGAGHCDGIARADGNAAGVTTSTSISVQTSQSSTQTNPSGAVCSLTTVAVTVTGGSTAPTGTVTIDDGVTSPVAIGSQTLNTSGTSGVASFTFALSAATHTLTAVYSGDSTYAGFTSPADFPDHQFPVQRVVCRDRLQHVAVEHAHRRATGNRDRHHHALAVLH